MADKHWLTGKRWKMDLKNAGEAGRTAFQSKKTGFGFPEEVPYRGGMLGEYNPEGKSIDVNMGSFDSDVKGGWGDRPTVPWTGGDLYSSKEKSRKILKGTEKYPRRTDYYNRMNEYSKGFTKGWYEPYLSEGIAKPIEKTLGGTSDSIGSIFRPLSDINSQVTTMLEALSEGGLGQFAGAAGEPLVLKSQLGDADDLLSDYAQAETDYEDALADLDEEEIAAGETRDKEDMIQNLLRKEITGQLPSQSEQQQANISRTGMAFSGPAQERILQESMGSDKTLRDVILKKRDIGETYDTALSDIEGKRDDERKLLEEAGENVGTGIKDLVGNAGTEAGKMSQMINDLVDSHKQLGSDMVSNLASPEGTKYSVKGQGSDIVGDRGYEGDYTTTGGYFDESPASIGGGPAYPEGYRPVEAGREEINKYKAFTDWLSSLKKADVASYLSPESEGQV